MVHEEFDCPIKEKHKLHSIRMNYEFWEKRIKKIIAGEGFLSIRMWSGKPYRSKQTCVQTLFEDDGVGIEKLVRVKEGEEDCYYIKEESGLKRIDTFTLAMNDGLLEEEFKEWFKNYPYGELALIHFTGFRYGARKAT